MQVSGAAYAGMIASTLTSVGCDTSIELRDAAALELQATTIAEALLGDPGGAIQAETEAVVSVSRWGWSSLTW